MTYQALYRKWRPDGFGEIVGQDHVTRTLQNAIAAERVSHAYLFCGTRGTGKTTTAKVLAKAINCSEGPGKEPCNRCHNCLSIKEGRSMDVVEIDAASNRGIDEIRELREKINFSPSGSRFRVYIIDEVHMLTNEAFNALLKTLEEPPSHVVFVLATTEPHKVPVTILSRCQRFDFRPVPVSEMVNRMRDVAAGSGLETSGDALEFIARSADGSLRDALSIMDQASSLGRGRINKEEIHRILGTVNEDTLACMADGLVKGDTASAVSIIDTLVTEGKDLRIFARQLGNYLRNLLVGEITPAEGGSKTGVADRHLLLHITKLLVRYEQDMKWSNHPRLLLELFVLESAAGSGDNSREDLSLRLARLEQKLKSLPDLRVEREWREDGGSPGVEYNVKETAATGSVKRKAETKKVANPFRDEGQKRGEGEKGEDVKVTEIKQNPPEKTSPEKSLPGVPLARVEKMWAQIKEAVKKENKAAFACLECAWPAAVSGDRLTLGFEEGDIAKDMLEEENNIRSLEKVLGSFFKGAWSVHCATGFNRPKAREKNDEPEMGFDGITEFFGGEEVEKAPPE